MAKYRKLPVTISAWQLTTDSLMDIVDLLDDNLLSWEDDPVKIVIKTLEGNMTAQDGDWIICGVNGEFYPCKPDIFDKTYEHVEKGSEAIAEKDAQLEARDIEIKRLQEGDKHLRGTLASESEMRERLQNFIRTTLTTLLDDRIDIRDRQSMAIKILREEVDVDLAEEFVKRLAEKDAQLESKDREIAHMRNIVLSYAGRIEETQARDQLAQRDAEIDRLREAMRSILIRCQEGDVRADWLPIINNIATKALAGGDGE